MADSVPLVSVVIPLYNKRDCIERCLSSVFKQTWEDYEIIIVDDGSSDGSAEAAKAIVRPSDTIFRQQNAGCGAARNRGCALASGRLIAFLDADDEWLAQHLETLVDLAERFPEAGLLAAGWRILGAKGLVIEKTIDADEGKVLEDYFRYGCYGSFISMSGCAVPKTVFEHIGGFRQHLYTNPTKPGVDTDLEVSIALQYPVAYHPRITSLVHKVANVRIFAGTKWEPGPPPYVELLIEHLSAGLIPSELEQSAREFAANRLLAHVARGLGTKSKRAQALELLDSPWLHNTKASRQIGKLQWASRLVPQTLIRYCVRFSTSRFLLPTLQIRDGVRTQVISRFSR